MFVKLSYKLNHCNWLCDHFPPTQQPYYSIKQDVFATVPLKLLYVNNPNNLLKSKKNTVCHDKICPSNNSTKKPTTTQSYIHKTTERNISFFSFYYIQTNKQNWTEHLFETKTKREGKTVALKFTQSQTNKEKDNEWIHSEVPSVVPSAPAGSAKGHPSSCCRLRESRGEAPPNHFTNMASDQRRPSGWKKIA